MRWYSQSAVSEPQPPEHLNEAELHVFNKVKKELEPVRLDVCTFNNLSSAHQKQEGENDLLTISLPHSISIIYPSVPTPSPQL